MILARVDGQATATVAHPSLKGQKLLFCTPVDEKGQATGLAIAAVDPLGAGRHSLVFITTDGQWTQGTVHDDHSPIRNQVIGLVDDVE